MRIELSCAECGGNNFTIDAATSDDSEVSCRDCGHRVGTWQEIKQLVLISIGRGAPAAPRATGDLRPWAHIWGARRARLGKAVKIVCQIMGHHRSAERARYDYDLQQWRSVCRHCEAPMVRSA